MKWFPSIVDLSTDPFVTHEREMIAALREHASALRSHGTPRRAKATPAAPPGDHHVSELDRARAQKVVRESARRLGMIVREGA